MRKAVSEDPRARAWALFLTTHRRLTESVEAALAAAELPPLAWYDVLWELEKAEEGRLRMHELAERVVITRSNLTRLVDRLESAGLISRQRCAEDGRGAHAALTAAGRAMRKRMWPVYSAQIDASFSSQLTKADGRLLVATFGKLLAAKL